MPPMFRAFGSATAALATLTLAACVSSTAAPERTAAPTPDSITPAAIEAHMRFLASDLLEGREAGTRRSEERRVGKECGSRRTQEEERERQRQTPREPREK